MNKALNALFDKNVWLPAHCKHIDNWSKRDVLRRIILELKGRVTVAIPTESPLPFSLRNAVLQNSLDKIG